MRRVVVATLALLVLAGACRKKSSTSSDVNASNKVAVRAVRLYYQSPQMVLAAEPRNVPLPESAAAAVPLVARELMKGPLGSASARAFPRDTIVRAAYLLPGGTVIVDLGGATLTRGWGTGSHEELMAVYSLVQTLTANFPDVKRVRIVINGTPAETLGGHISLERSLTPIPSLVDPRFR